MIVNSKRVPPRIRQSLNVEAGLNDGLAVPFLMLFIVLAVAEENTAPAGAVLARFLGEQLGYGTLIGIGIGTVGGWLLGLAHRTSWMVPPLGQLGVVALPLLCVIVAEETGASMFIAAFVAGFAVQFGFNEAGRHSVEFTEEWGATVQLFRVRLLRHRRGQRLGAFHAGRAALCRSEFDNRAHGACCTGVVGNSFEQGDRAVHGLVRPRQQWSDILCATGCN